MRENIRDKHGDIVYLTDERWMHIVEHHPELEDHRANVIKTIRSGKRTQDPLLPDKFYYNKRFPLLLDGYGEIEVVVLFRWQSGKPNNFVVTAYPV